MVFALRESKCIKQNFFLKFNKFSAEICSQKAIIKDEFDILIVNKNSLKFKKIVRFSFSVGNKSSKTAQKN